LANPHDTNFEFAKIIANNYSVEEQPMWDAATEDLNNQDIVFDEENIIDVITLAYIPNVGRLDVVIVRDNNMDGGFFGSL
jgi:hypothetical protein|tara:strand:- start:233 stop:472 length:240 start_codon:yes stop_codon:yes gene_type:complete